MEKKFKMLPPMMPNFISFEVKARPRQEGFNHDANKIPINFDKLEWLDENDTSDSENISKTASESMPSDFKKELMSLLNRHSKEQDSNTPDFIIAEYLLSCLKTFNESVTNRTLWYIQPRQ